MVQYWINHKTMIKLNIHEAKTHLSKYLARLAKGETILLCKRNEPIAEIRPLSARRRQPRKLGLAQGTVQIKPEFYDPLPDDVLDLFEGKGN